MEQNVIYTSKMRLYMEYWKDILLHLSKSLPPQVLFFWRAFDFQTIGNSTMLGLFCHPPWKLLMQKI